MTDPSAAVRASALEAALNNVEVRGLEYALAAILDCHTRIVARHVPSPRVRRVRAGYRDRSLRASLALRTERR